MDNSHDLTKPVAFVNADQLQGLTSGHYGYVEIYTDESTGRIPLYATPPQRKPPQFPTMLRKMWSGREVQDWINENWNKGEA